ncbi:hypothetical protein HK405_009986, partial [Cladochytrium tenue]
KPPPPSSPPPRPSPHPHAQSRAHRGSSAATPRSASCAVTSAGSGSDGADPSDTTNHCRRTMNDENADPAPQPAHAPAAAAVKASQLLPSRIPSLRAVGPQARRASTPATASASVTTATLPPVNHSPQQRRSIAAAEAGDLAQRKRARTGDAGDVVHDGGNNTSGRGLALTRRQFAKFVFLFDRVADRHREALKAYVAALSARVVPFIDKSVTHIITPTVSRAAGSFVVPGSKSPYNIDWKGTRLNTSATVWTPAELQHVAKRLLREDGGAGQATCSVPGAKATTRLKALVDAEKQFGLATSRLDVSHGNSGTTSRRVNIWKNPNVYYLVVEDATNAHRPVIAEDYGPVTAGVQPPPEMAAKWPRLYLDRPKPHRMSLFEAPILEETSEGEEECSGEEEHDNSRDEDEEGEELDDGEDDDYDKRPVVDCVLAGPNRMVTAPLFEAPADLAAAAYEPSKASGFINGPSTAAPRAPASPIFASRKVDQLRRRATIAGLLPARPQPQPPRQQQESPARSAVQTPVNTASARGVRPRNISGGGPTATAAAAEAAADAEAVAKLGMESRRRREARRGRPGAGYCEPCGENYTDYFKHINGARHSEYRNDPRNFYIFEQFRGRPLLELAAEHADADGYARSADGGGEHRGCVATDDPQGDTTSAAGEAGDAFAGSDGSVKGSAASEERPRAASEAAISDGGEASPDYIAAAPAAIAAAAARRGDSPGETGRQRRGQSVAAVAATAGTISARAVELVLEDFVISRIRKALEGDRRARYAATGARAEVAATVAPAEGGSVRRGAAKEGDTESVAASAAGATCESSSEGRGTAWVPSEGRSLRMSATSGPTSG